MGGDIASQRITWHPLRNNDSGKAIRHSTLYRDPTAQSDATAQPENRQPTAMSDLPLLLLLFDLLQLQDR